MSCDSALASEWCAPLVDPHEGASAMTRPRVLIGVSITAVLVVLACQAANAPANAPQDPKYALKIPGGLAFAEFEGYESWQTISISHNGDKLAVILGNPAMIAAYKAGIPG